MSRFDKGKVLKILEILGLEDRNHQDITLDKATLLRLNSLDLLDQEDCQNNGPTIGEIIGFACENGEIDFTFEGYIIGTERDDCRLTIDTVRGKCDFSEQMQTAINTYHYADEFEVDFKDNSFRAWWD